MTTANLIITDAYQKLGVYAPGETLSDADLARALTLLNDMMDNWIDDSIQFFQTLTVAVPLVNATQTYTVGTGAVVNTNRPLNAVLGPAEATVVSSGVTTNVNVVSDLEWNAIYNAPGLTGASGLSGVPNTMNYSKQYPWGVVGVAPTPNASMILNFSGLYGITGFALPSTNYTMTPGQQLALTTNLAAMLNSYFGVGQTDPMLVAQAQESKTLLTLTNRLSRALSRRNVMPQVPIAPRP